MDVQETAEDLREELPEVVDDELLAIGWYSEKRESHTGSVYISEEFGEYQESEGGVLETTLLESIGHGALESVHEETLLTTVRRYETVIDIAVHLGESKGIVVALRVSDTYLLDNVLDTIEEKTPEAIDLSTEP